MVTEMNISSDARQGILWLIFISEGTDREEYKEQLWLDLNRLLLPRGIDHLILLLVFFHLSKL